MRLSGREKVVTLATECKLPAQKDDGSEGEDQMAMSA